MEDSIIEDSSIADSILKVSSVETIANDRYMTDDKHGNKVSSDSSVHDIERKNWNSKFKI